MSTDIDVASSALVLMGAATISDFDGTSTEAIVANNIYETIVEAAMTMSRWRFCTGQQDLSLLVATPSARYDFAYQTPTSPKMLLLHGITVSNNIIKYDLYENKIYCDEGSDSTVVADYTYRSATADWPPYFKRALIYDLASVFAGSIAQDGNLAAHYEERSSALYTQAKTIEAQSRTTKQVRARGLINTRQR
jgi:hypothetical protein